MAGYASSSSSFAVDFCECWAATQDLAGNPEEVPNEQVWAKAAREVMRNPAVRQCAATGWWAGAPCVFVQNNLQVNIAVARDAEPAPASALGARRLLAPLPARKRRIACLAQASGKRGHLALVVASAPGVEAGSSELVKEMDSGVVGALTVSSSGGGGDVPVAYEAHAEEESQETTMNDTIGAAPSDAVALRLARAKVRALEARVAEAEAKAASAVDADVALRQARKDTKGAEKREDVVRKELEASARRIANLEDELRSVKSANSSKDAALQEVSRELERVIRERRVTDDAKRTTDARLARAVEDAEKYRRKLADVETNRRDADRGSRSEMDTLRAEVKKLERQRGELIAAFKKQLKLVDVLKRQRVHLEAATAVGFTEREFLSAVGVSG
ncbi:flagellar/basal body protein [Pycnococcus provasolii]